MSVLFRIVLLSPFALPAPAFAHAGSASYVRLNVVAHGATLAVALDLRDVEYALGVDANVVSVLARLLEPAIAMSVIVAAATNSLPRARAIGASTAFAFGLLQGFGFASALQGFDATRSSLAAALAAFNLGVEAGQLLVVAAVMPLLLALRTRDAYASRVVPAISSVVALSGAVWVWQRVAA